MFVLNHALITFVGVC